MNEEGLAYPEEDIVRLYREAKKKSEIIKILAQLNDTNTRTIKEVLLKHGLIKDLR